MNAIMMSYDFYQYYQYNLYSCILSLSYMSISSTSPTYSQMSSKGTLITSLLNTSSITASALDLSCFMILASCTLDNNNYYESQVEPPCMQLSY